MPTNTNELIINEYYDGASPQALAAKYGRHVNTVQKLAQAERARNPDRKRVVQVRGPASMSDKKTISDKHVMVGLKIVKYRAIEDITVSDFGHSISVSRSRVRNMEVGAHDFTLSELVSLSEVLGITLTELLNGR